MHTILIIGLIVFILIYLFMHMPDGFLRIIGNIVVKVSIAFLLLFLLNVFGSTFGIHIPINMFTVAVTTILGIFGLSSLLAVHIFLLM